MQPNTLTEHVTDWHAGVMVDRTNRTVRNIALTGKTSKNGYHYTEQALRGATALYEQKPVFLDHAHNKSRPHERSTRDLVGSIINPRYESGRIRGDIRVLDTDSGRTFLALAESDAPGVGMSHVVLAQRSGAGGAVDRIHDVVSVDAVVFPATTKTFRESFGAGIEGIDTDDTVFDHTTDNHAVDDDPIADNPIANNFAAGETNANETDNDNAMTTWGTENAPAPSSSPQQPIDESANTSSATMESEPSQRSDLLNDPLSELLIERDQLLSRLRDIEARDAALSCEQQVEQLLADARLPAYAVTTLFREQLLSVEQTQRRTLIRERQQLLESARRQSPFSTVRTAPSAEASSTNVAFVTAIKRRAC